MLRPKRSPIWKVPRDEFIKRYEEASSMAEFARSFGYHGYGGSSVHSFRARLEHEGLPIIDGRKASRNLRPLEEVLVENSDYLRSNLKLRLLKEGLLENKCEKCGIIEWKGERLVMVLDHINGVHDDNRIENLRMLCPNCNSQTDTFSGRNKPYKKERAHGG